MGHSFFIVCFAAATGASKCYDIWRETGDFPAFEFAAFAFCMGFLMWYSWPGINNVLNREARDAQAARVVEVQSHRGYGDLEPHNTLRAFRAAGGHPDVWSVEFDVQRSADGHLVVTHGPEYGENAVPSTSLAVLQEPDLGHGEHVPLLTDVVDVCLEGKLLMNVELKTADPEVIDATLDLLREKNALQFCRISSFHRAALKHVMEVAPELPIGALYNPGRGPLDPSDPAKGSKIEETPEDFVSWFKDHSVPGDSVNLRSETVTEQEVLDAKFYGKQVMIWCACVQRPGFEEGPEEYRRLMALGADVICCNKPEVCADTRNASQGLGKSTENWLTNLMLAS